MEMTEKLVISYFFVAKVANYQMITRSLTGINIASSSVMPKAS